MDEIPNAFIAEARSYLTTAYLPRIERCLEQLSDEKIWWRPGEESNSIGNLLLHLSGNVRQWIVSGIGGAPDKRIRQQEFDERSVWPRAELLNRLKQALAEADATLAAVDGARLLEPLHIQGHDVTVLEAVFHVVEHFSMHTGQIILLTKMLRGEDLRFYDLSSGKAIETWHSPGGEESA